jgi:hypothetical protein
MKKIFLLLFLAFVVSICQAQYVCTQQETNLRRASAKDGEGYMPVLTDDTVSFIIAFSVATFVKDYDPFRLGALSYYFTSKQTDTAIYHNNRYRFFSHVSSHVVGDFYVREDTLTGRIFRYFPELDTEVVTCDMTLQPGDTFHFPDVMDHVLPVDSHPNIVSWIYYDYRELGERYAIVDSVTYANGRKVIWFPMLNLPGSFFAVGYYPRSYPLCFIEGVGPTYGPFAGFESDYLGLLLCVHHNDSLAYMTDPELGCEQLVASVPEHPDVSMKLYPNPAGDILNMEFEGIDDPQGLLTITDLAGVVVHTQACHDPVTRLNVSHLAPGLYVVGFRNENGVVVRKFVKM